MMAQPSLPPRRMIQISMSRFDTAQLDYEKYLKKLAVVRKRLNRPLTLSEKILYSHLDEPETQVSARGC